MSIPHVVDGETELDSELFNPWVDHMNGLQTGALPIALAGIEGALGEYEPLVQAASRVRDVREWGVVGDGVTDDTSKWATALSELIPGDRLVVPQGFVCVGNPATRHVFPADCTLDARGATLRDVLFEPRARSRFEGGRYTSAADKTKYAFQSGAGDDPGVSFHSCRFDSWSSGVFLQATIGNVEQRQYGWVIDDCDFEDCLFPLLVIRSDAIQVSYNRFVGNTTGNIMFFGGTNGRIIGNVTDGGVTGIAFIYHRSTVSRFSPISRNIVMGNEVRGHSEEGITFDVRGNEAANTGCVEVDTIASKSTSGSSNRVTLTASGWSASPEAVYYGYYMTFLDGALAGRAYKIAAHPAGTAMFDFSDTVLTDAEHALIDPGDRVTIGMPALGNVVSGNIVDASQSVSEAAEYEGVGISHWGNTLYSTIVGNTVVNGEIVFRTLEGITRASPTYADNSGKAPVMHCAVVGNTVDHSNIRFGFKGYGGFADSPSFQSIGNTAVGNVVIGGDMIADANQVERAGNVVGSYVTANGGAFSP